MLLYILISALLYLLAGAAFVRILKYFDPEVFHFYWRQRGVMGFERKIYNASEFRQFLRDDHERYERHPTRGGRVQMMCFFLWPVVIVCAVVSSLAVYAYRWLVGDD